MRSLDGINGWSIQTLLRGENDSKQSDEIQATGICEIFYFMSRLPYINVSLMFVFSGNC